MCWKWLRFQRPGPRNFLGKIQLHWEPQPSCWGVTAYIFRVHGIQPSFFSWFWVPKLARRFQPSSRKYLCATWTGLQRDVSGRIYSTETTSTHHIMLTSIKLTQRQSTVSIHRRTHLSSCLILSWNRMFPASGRPTPGFQCFCTLGSTVANRNCTDAFLWLARSAILQSRRISATFPNIF